MTLFHIILKGIPRSIPEPIWDNLFTCGFIALALTLGLRISFEKLEKEQLVICGILVIGTIIGAFMVRPDLGKGLVGGLSVTHLPPFPQWAPPDAVKNPLLTMATAFAYVGGSVMGYIVYANWIGLHRWGMTGHQRISSIREHAFKPDAIAYLSDDPEQVSRFQTLIAPLRWDVGMGAIVLFIVTASFMLSGAAVLYPLKTEFKGWRLLTEQAHIWSNIHPSLVWGYYICIITALWGTLQAIPEIYARVMQEVCQSI